MEVTVEGELIRPEELEVPNQWFTSRKSKIVPLESITRESDQSRAPTKAMGRKMALKSIERRQMRIPTEAAKIVLRPRGGLTKLIQYGTAHLGDVIKAAAGIDPKEEGDDIFSPNLKQQSILVGTTCEKRKLKYACIKQIMLDGECVETSAYVATPEDCGKGVIYDIPLFYTIEDIKTRLDRRDNPKILGVRRLGKESKAVMLLFEENTVPRWILFGGVPLRCQLYKKKFEICTACGRLGHRDDVCPDPKNVRCRGCGLERPPKDHSCEPKCQLCGKGHILGDKKCREIFRTPYVVKKKQWEQKQRQTDSSERQSRPREPKPEKGYKVRDESFPRLDTRNPVEPRGRSGSRANSRGRSQSRGRSSSRGLANPRKRGWSQERKGVSFAKAVTQAKEDKRADEIDQLKKMVEKLSGIVESQKELEFNSTSSVGSTIILVTDGEENRDPSIDDVLPGLTRKSIKVHTYALGPEASTKLEQIADETDGTAYYFGDFQNNTIAALGSAFLVSVTSHLDTMNHPIILLDKTASFRTAEEFPFTVPQELGANTKISITSLSVQKFDFYVKDANGQNCTDCNKEIGDQLEIIHIPETEATTLWTLVLIPQAGTVSNVTVTVQSTQRDPSVHPIRAQSFVKEDKSKNQVTIYSRVSKGDRGVLRAVVIATVTLPGLSGTTFLHLKDNGLGADETRNDGEYSAYFSHLVGQGRYSVRTDVTTKEDTLLTPPRSTAMPGRLRAGLLELGEEPEQAVQEISAEQPEGADINMVVYAGAVNILRNITQKDLNPADVRDLRVDNVTVDGKNITATLSWTCMGAHLDSGRANHTDLRASSDPRVLLRKFEKATQISTENLLEGTLVPLDPLKIQTVRIRIPQELVSRTGGTPGSVFLALRTNNSRGQVSAVSNFVQLDWDTSSGGSVVDHTEAHPPPAVRTEASPRTVAHAATTPYTASTPPAELKGQDEKSSSGLLLGAVLVAVVAVVVAVALYALMSQSGVVGATASHDDAESGDDESTVAW
ncbi:calcium-activated chloride channel regulator 1 [Ixodes scapularis]